jgi:hypothetical protein
MRVSVGLTKAVIMLFVEHKSRICPQDRPKIRLADCSWYLEAGASSGACIILSLSLEDVDVVHAGVTYWIS